MPGRYWKDMWAMIKHYRNVWDPTGWTAMFLEWGAALADRCRQGGMPLTCQQAS